MKKISIVLAIAIIAILAILAYRGDLSLSAWNGTPSQAVLNETFAWSFSPASGTPAISGSSATSTGATNVTLTTSKKSYVVGTFDGSCFDIKQSNWRLVPGERAAAVCWQPGGGKELGVFIKGSGLELMVGTINDGSIDTPGIRAHSENLMAL